MLPQNTKALILRKNSRNDSETVYNDAVIEERPIPTLKPGEVLVKMGAVAFNHRELWIREGLYPGLIYGSTFGADGAGLVIASFDKNDPLLNTRVFLTPIRGWKSHPDAPESRFGILGGGSFPPIGTFSEFVVVERSEVIVSPAHLDDIHIAAWPVAGLTAWRATMLNARVEAGHNILVTGIGGAVALCALQICLAKGAKVFVTSGNKGKIDRAVSLGASGGVNYNNADWPKQLEGLLQSHNGTGLLDSVVDSGGGNIMQMTGRLLKQGGCIVCLGMTAQPKITFTMREVLQQKRLIGSTMGSRRDMEDATAFLVQHKIVPVVSHVLHGLQEADKGFELMKSGSQFGKIVIILERDQSKL